MTREDELIKQVEDRPVRQMARPEEFRYDAYQAGYYDILTGFFYKDPKSINALIPVEYWPMKIGKDKDGIPKETLVKPSNYLMNVSNGLLVETSTWWPGMPRIIEGYLAIDGAMIADERRNMFNTYMPPPPLAAPLSAGQAEVKAKLWIDHVKGLWPDPKEHGYFLDYCAHMVQRPEEKCNAIITLSGAQGIGKDVSLIPVKAAVGQWNVCDISPDEFASPYNPWVQCVMLIINEMRPTKEDFHASSIYEKLKRISVTPPDTLAVSDKYMRMRYVMNVLRTFITTNDMTAMYINATDRRMAVFHSTVPQGWRSPEYFSKLTDWLTKKGGNDACAAYLATRDISKFEPKSKPAATAGWEAIVSGWSAPNDAISAAIESLNEPIVMFSTELYRASFDGADDIRALLQHPRKMQHRLQTSGYFVYPLTPALEFKGTSNQKTLKFKTAFIKYELMHEKERYTALLQERGNLLANDVAILHQSQPSAVAGGKF